MKCPNCNGTGVIAIPWYEYDPRRSCSCPTCNGTGKVAK